MKELYNDNFYDIETYKVTPQQTRKWYSDTNFKRLNRANIDKIIKDVYSPKYWDKFQTYGVMNLPWEENKWSLLNKLNTNWGAMPILINGVNRSIFLGESEIPLFKLSTIKFGTDIFYKEYNRFIQFLYKNRISIFKKFTESEGSDIINEVFKYIESTSNSGGTAEKKVMKLIPNIFPFSNNVRSPKTDGELNDMLNGVDITFNVNSENKTMQVKRCSVNELKDGSFLTKGLSMNKHYNVNYIVCVTPRNTYFFKYSKKKVKLDNGNIKLDKDLLYKKI